jgi:hypothetical protein
MVLISSLLFVFSVDLYLALSSLIYLSIHLSIFNFIPKDSPLDFIPCCDFIVMYFHPQVCWVFKEALCYAKLVETMKNTLSPVSRAVPPVVCSSSAFVYIPLPLCAAPTPSSLPVPLNSCSDGWQSVGGQGGKNGRWPQAVYSLHLALVLDQLSPQQLSLGCRSTAWNLLSPQPGRLVWVPGH